MSGSADLFPETEEISTPDHNLPISSIVRAVCQGASSGPDILYEVMLKLSLMVEATAPTYGLSIWSIKTGKRASLKWAEGLDEREIDAAEKIVTQTLCGLTPVPEIKAGDPAICLLLAAPTGERPGAALYGRCVHPLSEKQARDLKAIVDVANLAHSHAATVRIPPPEPEPAATQPAHPTLPGLVYVSRAMIDVAHAVERIKDSESSVLITGESGTGKELVARAVHRLSRRADKEFIPFNCSAVPAELIESMLFGHRKGTFTGALNDHGGLIRAAENGTLFLDEIGDLPLPLQPKLLRFLQEGEVHTLGEISPRKVNVRVLAATHKNLEQLVRDQTFREDLYYRIATLTINIPPLRERPDDISTLISHFVSHFARRNDRPIEGITLEAIQILEGYSWPGNVRELAGEIERLVLYAEEGGYITPEQISERILPEVWRDRKDDGSIAGTLDDLLEDYERRVIKETLKRHDCNVARASAALGLSSRQTLYKKLKRLAIDIGDFLQEEKEPGLQMRGDRQ
ncbi:MAG TPA: sigma 54-interacting transcriptional regulator [Pyrinomonadaceae bacterium]|nr:sigma 54-interacting transcriptional regulator [Pyrinomonadaceae bacterium]